MEIEVVKGRKMNSGTQIYTGAIPVSVLVNYYAIPYRNAKLKTGYQRKPQEARISKFVTQMRKKTLDIIPSIMLNARSKTNKSIDNMIVYKNNKVVLDVERFSNDVKFNIVDGQHRVIALKRLYDESPEKWGSYLLQFVLMLGATEEEELEQFYIVNSTAKSVRTDLAYDLLKQQTLNNPKIMGDLIESAQEWKIYGQNIVENLNKDSIVWHNRIQLANETKSNTTVTSSGFVNSLKNILTNPFFQHLQVPQQVKIINCYWLAIQKTLPEAFSENFHSYSIQKGLGVSIMHEVLPVVIDIVRSRGQSVFEEDSYWDVLNDTLPELEGDNANGEAVSGSDFWLPASKGGAAGSYSSSAGKRVLVARIKTLLPDMDIE